MQEACRKSWLWQTISVGSQVIGGLAIQIQATGRQGGRQTSARNTGNCLVGIDIHAADRDHKQKAGDGRHRAVRRQYKFGKPACNQPAD